MIVRPYQSLLIVNNAESRTAARVVSHAHAEPVGKVEAKPWSEKLLTDGVAKTGIVHFLRTIRRKRPQTGYRHLHRLRR